MRNAGNEAPCGGTERGAAHFLAQSDSRVYFQWKTLMAHASSNCTVSLSSGFDDYLTDFKVLRPRDDSGDPDGKFPCGRKSGFEGKEFRLPDDIVCDKCVIQLVHEVSSKEKIHQCADIVILENT